MLSFFAFIYCPNKGAMSSIVVSLSCTTYQWESLIVLQEEALKQEATLATLTFFKKLSRQ